jgi:hypothetical protein
VRLGGLGECTRLLNLFAKLLVEDFLDSKTTGTRHPDPLVVRYVVVGSLEASTHHRSY